MGLYFSTIIQGGALLKGGALIGGEALFFKYPHKWGCIRGWDSNIGNTVYSVLVLKEI